MSNPFRDPLRRWERAGVALFLIGLIAFGILIEIRSAFLTQRLTDLDVYLRAAWAVQSGDDIYQITNKRGCWHYCYPAFTAILATPLADRPEGIPSLGKWSIPFPISVGLWYFLSIICLFAGIHQIVKGLQRSGSIANMQSWSRSWYYLHLLPIYILIPAIGFCLSRGQINLFVLLFLGLYYASSVSGKKFLSGIYLSIAICMKVIPAFLVLLLFWQRDKRGILGLACGLFLGLIALPSLVWGPEKALAVNKKFIQVMILPSLLEDADQTRAKELTDVNATDNQSFQALLHNYWYWDVKNRPPQSSSTTKILHLLLGGFCAITILLAYGNQTSSQNPLRFLLCFGSLLVIMILISPVSHQHYFSWNVPLVLGLISYSWQQKRELLLQKRYLISFTSMLLCSTFPLLPAWESYRDFGFPSLVSLWMCYQAVWILRKSKDQVIVKSANDTKPDRGTVSPPGPLLHSAA